MHQYSMTELINGIEMPAEVGSVMSIFVHVRNGSLFSFVPVQIGTLVLAGMPYR